VGSRGLSISTPASSRVGLVVACLAGTPLAVSLACDATWFIFAVPIALGAALAILIHSTDSTRPPSLLSAASGSATTAIGCPWEDVRTIDELCSRG
jgi:hypothetical protein